MPPKKKLVEHREEDELDREREITEPIESSPGSSASSVSTRASSLSTRSYGSLTSDQLEQILATNQKAMLEASHQSMTALLATLSPLSSGAGSVAARVPQIKVPKWTDEETPFEYFGKFEKALKHNGVDKSSWGHLLPVYLAGRAQAALAQVDSESLDDYEAVKKILLESLGDTPACADRKWWTLSRQAGEEPGQFYLRVRSTGLRKLHGLNSREEIVEHVVLSRFLSLLPSDCYSSVISKQPKTGMEAARLVQEFEETRTFSRRRQPWKQDSNHHSHYSGRREQGGGNSSGGGANNASPKEGVVAQNPSASGSQPSAGKNGRVEKTGRKPITCYGCGEPGHIRPNCPNRVRRVGSPVSDPLMDWLAGSAIKGLKVDTGADRSVVSAEYVPKSAYLKKTVILDSWQGKQFSKHRVAKLLVKVGEVEVAAEFAVADVLDCPALLGNDLGAAMRMQLLSMVLERAKVAHKEGGQEVVQPNVTPMPVEETEVEPVRSTRAQVGKERVEDEQDELASAQSECTPIPLSDIYDFPDSYFEDDPVPVAVDDLSDWPKGGCGTALPLPKLDTDGEGVEKLVREQQADSTLGKLLALGKKSEKGYGFENGVLVQRTEDSLGDEVQRIVVPEGRRLQVLQLGHSHATAGHFGFKKTFSRISLHFLWPRMWGQVKQFVRSCAGCQRAARNANSRAPLQPLPCVGEPFSKVAFDIVGPLPKSKSGYRYILTMMCLFSKFPEAIPLKRVDNESVLEAMVEIFSRHGLPKEMLTDQGSVFTSKLTRKMCKIFEIHKVQTSPYHPQSDGALERWHACLKGMLKRSEMELKEWDKHLKYLLFAYRDTPHCVTGFSPFTLLFGRNVRGPLELLSSAWLESDGDEFNVYEWLNTVKGRMAEMAEVVSDREMRAKTEMKKYYDRSAKMKSFSVGQMVLVRKPGLHAKFGDFWEGPYQVEARISPVTYKVQVPGKPKLCRVLHCNMLKLWTTPAGRIHRVATITEEDEVEQSQGLILAREGFEPSAVEQSQLDKVLSKYPDVLNPEPGRTEVLALQINTEGHTPVSSHPYRIAPRWKEEVKAQLDQLLQLGIIRPSVSPWSSSVVTVKKKDGGVRICIDFRAVNAVTQPDPYQMPLNEEILDRLASARFISKVDLNKGFHQIPIHKEDCAKTAFCTPWGKFEFTGMPFGLRNGPAVFQRLMDQLLHEDKEVAQVYIDDIAIFSDSWEAHCRDIDRVLGRLKRAGLTANTSKCRWGQTKCEFLGHIVGEGKVSPAELKVKAVREFCQPKTKRQVRQFLGLTGYYRKFCQN